MNESNVDAILSVVASKIFSAAGFDSTSTKAMAVCVQVLKETIGENAKILASSASHAGKAFVTEYEFIKSFYALNKFNFEIYGVSEIDDKIEYEEYKIEKEWTSPLANFSEKFIHIYDFMPDFPPTHTYRNTKITERTENLESLNVKNRMDQSLKSEANMFKLFKSSGSLPPFINFLYKFQEGSENE
ncbi:hypothetical protein NUSPORA_00173 [Nucleospora cyclopteri]